MEDSRWNQMGQVIARAWSDPAYKARLLTDATSVLKEEGIDYGSGIEVRILENSDSVRYITLPQPPSEVELSEEQLGRVAGGARKRSAADCCHIPDS
jgi:hypothetical protein